MKRVYSRAISLFAIAALLFTQLAVSAYACPMLADALNAQDEVISALASSADDADMGQLGLCQKHCENGQQSVSESGAPLASVVLAPAFVVSLPAVQASSVPSTALYPALIHATSPPLRIRDCCFRI